MADDLDHKTSEVEDPHRRILSPEELKKRNQRNAAMAFGIIAFVVIIFLVTVLRMGGDVATRTF